MPAESKPALKFDVGSIAVSEVLELGSGPFGAVVGSLARRLASKVLAKEQVESLSKTTEKLTPDQRKTLVRKMNSFLQRAGLTSIREVVGTIMSPAALLTSFLKVALSYANEIEIGAVRTCNSRSDGSSLVQQEPGVSNEIDDEPLRERRQQRSRRTLMERKNSLTG